MEKERKEKTETLYQKLKTYSETDAYPFHMPGHKRRISHFPEAYQIDITEIEGFDNLHHAEGILLEAQRRAAALYGVEETYFLVNGSTGGLLAAVSAAVRRGGRLLMARNCHKASYHAALLRDLKVTYLYPKIDALRGLIGSVDPDEVRRALKLHPDIQAVLITSPTYDGVVSDVRAIAEAAHDAGAILIVDEAHGAHLALHPYFPDSAVSCGADIVVQSAHKTLPSLTQTALLHVCGSRADRGRLRRYLGIYQTSSPSYVLMASLDACTSLLAGQGKELFEAYVRRLESLRAALAGMNGLHLVDGSERELFCFAYDRSRLVISTEGCHPEGNAGAGGGVWLSNLLRSRYGLELEMEAERYATALTSVADTQEGFDRLARALLEIDDQLVRPEQSGESGRQALRTLRCEAALTLAQAEDAEKQTVPLLQSCGEVSAEFAYLYPPGIPLLVPGERIPEGLPEQLEQYRSLGLHLQGLEDRECRRIRVCKGAKPGYCLRGTRDLRKLQTQNGLCEPENEERRRG